VEGYYEKNEMIRFFYSKKDFIIEKSRKTSGSRQIIDKIVSGKTISDDDIITFIQSIYSKIIGSIESDAESSGDEGPKKFMRKLSFEKDPGKNLKKAEIYSVIFWSWLTTNKTQLTLTQLSQFPDILSKLTSEKLSIYETMDEQYLRITQTWFSMASVLYGNRSDWVSLFVNFYHSNKEVVFAGASNPFCPILSGKKNLSQYTHLITLENISLNQFNESDFFLTQFKEDNFETNRCMMAYLYQFAMTVTKKEKKSLMGKSGFNYLQEFKREWDMFEQTASNRELWSGIGIYIADNAYAIMNCPNISISLLPTPYEVYQSNYEFQPILDLLYKNNDFGVGKNHSKEFMNHLLSIDLVSVNKDRLIYYFHMLMTGMESNDQAEIGNKLYNELIITDTYKTFMDNSNTHVYFCIYYSIIFYSIREYIKLKFVAPTPPDADHTAKIYSLVEFFSKQAMEGMDNFSAIKLDAILASVNWCNTLINSQGTWKQQKPTFEEYDTLTRIYTLFGPGIGDTFSNGNNERGFTHFCSELYELYNYLLIYTGNQKEQIKQGIYYYFKYIDNYFLYITEGKKPSPYYGSSVKNKYNFNSPVINHLLDSMKLELTNIPYPRFFEETSVKMSPCTPKAIETTKKILRKLRDSTNYVDIFDISSITLATTSLLIEPETEDTNEKIQWVINAINTLFAQKEYINQEDTKIICDVLESINQQSVPWDDVTGEDQVILGVKDRMITLMDTILDKILLCDTKNCKDFKAPGTESPTPKLNLKLLSTSEGCRKFVMLIRNLETEYNIFSESHTSEKKGWLFSKSTISPEKIFNYRHVFEQTF
jgi:hypothetical protein